MRDINLIAISHLVCLELCGGGGSGKCVCQEESGVWQSYKNQIYKMLTLISFLIYEYVWVTLG